MTSATTQLTRLYRSTENLARWIIFCLIALIIGGIIALLTYFNFIGSVNRVIRNTPMTFFEASRARIEILGIGQTFDNLYHLFIILSVSANLLITILFMIWLYKSP